MPDTKGYARIGAALAHLIDSMNKASAWKDHSAELVQIAAAFRRIAEPLGPEGVEDALLAHVESEHKDGRATYAKIGTTLMANIEFVLCPERTRWKIQEKLQNSHLFLSR